MAKVSPNTVLNIIQSTYNSSGGTPIGPPTYERALAIAYAESGLNETSIGHNANGSSDYGLFQINSSHFGENSAWNATTMLQAGPNVSAAQQISNQWRNYTPWSTFNSGAYLLYIPQAKKDVSAWQGQRDPAAVKAVAGAVNTVSDAASTASNAWGTLSNPRTWLRVGYGVAGVALIVVTVSAIAQKTPVGAAAISGATSVATKGAMK
jgi:hypothetical protein